MSALRGSSVFEGHAAVMERWAPAKGTDQRDLSTIKNRFNPSPPPPMRMEFEHERWGYRYVHDDEKLMAVRQVLQTLGRDNLVTISVIAEETGEKYDTARRWANRAVEAGYAKKGTIDRQVGYRYVVPSDEEDDESSLTIT